MYKAPTWSKMVSNILKKFSCHDHQTPTPGVSVLQSGAPYAAATQATAVSQETFRHLTEQIEKSVVQHYPAMVLLSPDK